MQDKIDGVRERVLDRMLDYAQVKPSGDPIGSVPGHLRNLAAVYEILTQQKMAECRLSGPVVDSAGVPFFMDPYGRRVDVAEAATRT